MEYIHPYLNSEVDAVGGHYFICREALFQDKDKWILYFIGYAITDRTCSGSGGCGYAIVAGHIIKYRSGMSKHGRHVPETAPVEKPRYEEITHMLKSKEGVTQAHFMTQQNNYKVIF